MDKIIVTIIMITMSRRTVTRSATVILKNKIKKLKILKLIIRIRIIQDQWNKNDNKNTIIVSIKTKNMAVVLHWSSAEGSITTV